MPSARFVGQVSETAQAALVERYRTTHDADERSRCQMILFSAQGKRVAAIAELTLFGEDTVLYWFERYETDGLDGLATKPRSGRPPKSI